ncbi:hypothetical protein M9H77_03333 [Catharanthus roseus]|uniref:Uncharacterized protein n=1 Tax=Catharanthus roseus TaxID=4058 RepID=A0ACC0CB47_CATRO|nr:hypothetical protein M9H77_03333 [Catharanthus roseus]
MVQMEKSKNASLGGFVASKSKEGFLEPTAEGRVLSTIPGRGSGQMELEGFNLPCTVGRDLVPTSIVGVARKSRSFWRVWRVGEASISLVDSPSNIQRFIFQQSLYLIIISKGKS